MAQQPEPIVLDPKDPEHFELALVSLRQLRGERQLAEGDTLRIGIADETVVDGRRIMVGPFVRTWARLMEHGSGDQQHRDALRALGITEDSGRHRKDTPHSMPVEIAIDGGPPKGRGRGRKPDALDR